MSFKPSKNSSSFRKTQPTNSTSSVQPTVVTLAPFWRRLLAWLYDLLGALGIFILAMVVGQLVLWLVTLPWVEHFNQVSAALSHNVFWSIYLFLAVQYYYVWCWVKGGQTVGMKAWKLQLYKTDGSLLDWKEAYIRSFLSFGGLATIWSLVDKENRGWHDLIFDSRVVQLPDGLSKKR